MFSDFAIGRGPVFRSGLRAYCQLRTKRLAAVQVHLVSCPQLRAVHGLRHYLLSSSFMIWSCVTAAASLTFSSSA